jgi:4-amino-4-deoxy-L-arabinose transferase-like glycosyltransferase
MTPSHQNARSADSAKLSISSICKLVAICAALLVFAGGLYSRSFVDEYAYITQSYYTDLMLEGRFNDKAWLEFCAYDLQPLPKYLIGLALHLAHIELPGRGDANNWYRSYKSVGGSTMLAVARLPIVVLGVLGCAAIFCCGVLVKDTRVGFIAAALLVLNPLYRLHAHRAMSDVPCEALMIAALALALWVGQRLWCGRFGTPAVIGPVLAGVAAGLALLCKFNGFLGLMIVASWCAAACILPGPRAARKLAIVSATSVTVMIALLCFVALNPYLTARPRGPVGLRPAEEREILSQSPWQRFLGQIAHRVRLSEHQKKNFPDDALHTLRQKTEVLLIQGFGRFGPLGPFESDSTVRFSGRQDWGVLVWLPLVMIGLIETIRLWRDQLRSGRPPTAGALLIWAALAWIVVTYYLPMAWDRYLLPIQSGNALLAAVGASALWDRLTGRVAALRGST